MSIYLIGDRRIDTADEATAQAALAAAHAGRIRPLCTCRTPGPEMYIARVDGHFIVKRLPGTGGQHAFSCSSHEPPYDLSGLGDVMGQAIQEHDDGTTLKLDFALRKLPPKSAPTPAEGTPADTVRTDGKKLTLRGLTHFLWEQAGLTRWSPKMEGKRSWQIVQFHLSAAAAGKTTKGGPLSDSIWIPEPWSAERRDDIARRRATRLAPVMAAHAARTRPLAILIGEIKGEFEELRGGWGVTIKHVPDMQFMMAVDLHRRLIKRFAAEFALHGALPGSRLILTATFGIGLTGIAGIEEATVMLVDERWLPIESLWEHTLIGDLARSRKFRKCLRYNLAADHPIAAAILYDTQPAPVALHILPPGAPDAYMRLFHRLVDDSEYPAWFWVVAEGNAPLLPAHQGYLQPPTPGAPPPASSAS